MISVSKQKKGKKMRYNGIATCHIHGEFEWRGYTADEFGNWRDLILNFSQISADRTKAYVICPKCPKREGLITVELKKE